MSPSSCDDVHCMSRPWTIVPFLHESTPHGWKTMWVILTTWVKLEHINKAWQYGYSQHANVHNT